MAAKTDMERVGLFIEPAYLPAKYVSSNKVTTRDLKPGRQMLTEATKKRSALDDGYFSRPFVRVFEGESVNNPYVTFKKYQMEQKKKIIGRNWVPVVASEKPSGIGSPYGTFAGFIPAFRNEGGPAPVKQRSQSVTEKEKKKRNFLIPFPKKGSGSGYLDITIGPYPEYKSCVTSDYRTRKFDGKPFYSYVRGQDFFGEVTYASEGEPRQPKSFFNDQGKNKRLFIPPSVGQKLGGMKAGCFTPYPPYQEEPYRPYVWRPRPIRVVNDSGKTFIPNPDIKSTPTTSTLAQNVLKYVNNLNRFTTDKVMNY